MPLLTSGEVSGIRAQIEQNWNVPIDALETCKTPFELRVSLLNDGTVKHVEILGNETITDGCRIWVDSARRAVLRASPIKLLAGKEMTSIKVRFDPNEIAKSLLE